MSPSDSGFHMYVMCINMLDVLKGFVSSQYEHVDTHCIHRYEILLVHYSTQNAKLCRVQYIGENNEKRDGKKGKKIVPKKWKN